jgi:putative antitoxin of VapBC-like toxin-antitoxin system
MRRKIMPTNLAIDDKLIEDARLVGQHRTKKAVVTEALQEYIQRRKQVEIIKLFGTIEYDSDYNYKEQRKIK